MTALEQVTGKLLSAIRREDFEALNRVLEERGGLLASGAEVTQHAWELGDDACRALVSLKRHLVLESSRLEQIRKIGETFPQGPSAHREYFG